MIDYIPEVRFQVYAVSSSNEYLAMFDDLSALTITQTWGRGGMAVMSVPVGHGLLDYLTLDQYLVFVVTMAAPKDGWSPSFSPYSNPYGTAWRVEMRGLIRDYQLATDSLGNIYYLIYVRHLTGALDRYITAYPTDIVSRAVWSGVEMATVANDIARFNATAAGTVASGRVRDVTVVRGMTDAGSIAGTPLIDYTAEPGQPLLQILSEFGQASGFVIEVTGDFIAVVNLNDAMGNLWIRQRISVDRSVDVVFAMELDNVSSVSISSDSLQEHTIAVVGGRGSGSARSFSVRTGANWNVANDKEMWVDASGSDDIELPDLGDLALAQARAKIFVDATIVSSRGWVYGRDFNLGDMVALLVNGVITVKVIETVELVWDQGLTHAQSFILVEPS